MLIIIIIIIVIIIIVIITTENTLGQCLAELISLLEVLGSYLGQNTGYF